MLSVSEKQLWTLCINKSTCLSFNVYHTALTTTIIFYSASKYDAVKGLRTMKEDRLHLKIENQLVGLLCLISPFPGRGDALLLLLSDGCIIFSMKACLYSGS